MRINIPVPNGFRGLRNLIAYINANFVELYSSVGGGGYNGDPTIVQQNSTHRFATDAEKTTWSGKQAALGFTPSNSNHNHDATYAPVVHTHDYSPTSHNHDASYSALAHTHAGVYSPVAHNHDASYSALGHNHAGVYEPANSNIQTHVAQAHAPSNAQANADITKGEIEAKLTGQIDTHTHAGGGGLGYAINVQALTSSPADGQTVYFGVLPKAPTTTANISKVYIRKAGTIKIAEIYCYSGTAGSNEAWSLYIRKNNSGDTLIATLSVSASERVFSKTDLALSVAVGDYIEIKGIQPTWGTNPLTTIYGGYIYIE